MNKFLVSLVFFVCFQDLTFGQSVSELYYLHGKEDSLIDAHNYNQALSVLKNRKVADFKNFCRAFPN